MGGIYHFVKSTLIGGLIVLLPIAVVGSLLAWAVQVSLRALAPVAHWLPDHSVAGMSLAVAIAVAALIGVCFLAGLLAETALVRCVGSRAERLALSIPGYALMRSVGANLVGVEGKHATRTVLARFEASWQLGFLMETLADGRRVVFVPGVPRALVGTLHLLPADRVQILAMSVSTALDALGRLGIGVPETCWRPAPDSELSTAPAVGGAKASAES